MPTTAMPRQATDPKRARVEAILKTQSVAQLETLFDLTDAPLNAAYAEKRYDEAAAICHARGWIMDELESRLTEDAYEAWMESRKSR